MQSVEISQIINAETVHLKPGYFAVCWIKNEIQGIQVDDKSYHNISNSIFFLAPHNYWKIIKSESSISSGLILYLAPSIFNDPRLNRLHINEVSILSSNEIPMIKLAPGIEMRIQSILEMLDELVSTNLKHKEEAILSLLNTFFIYTDGKCNIKTTIEDTSSKKALVYNYKKKVASHFKQYHDVNDYANLLNVSSKYLNACVKETLDVNAKHVILEQLVMHSRHALKFSDMTVKEISYDLGFSSPDYFSYFYKKHTGVSPSVHKQTL
ncbi:MAG: helix-turn-helix domain-containing protein [Fulvivirga sp.]